MKIALILLCLVGYVYSQTSCGTCFPGTSTSKCGYRKPTDPIICCNDGKKYTPCTYTCVKTCIPSLRITGCGATCIATTDTTCPPIAPVTTTMPPPTNATETTTTALPCVADGVAPCNVPFAAPADSCGITPNPTSCALCKSTAPAKGQCVDGTTLCTIDTVAPCDVLFVPPTKACDVNPDSPACKTCTAGSVAIGGCIVTAG